MLTRCKYLYIVYMLQVWARSLRRRWLEGPRSVQILLQYIIRLYSSREAYQYTKCLYTKHSQPTNNRPLCTIHNSILYYNTRMPMCDAIDPTDQINLLRVIIDCILFIEGEQKLKHISLIIPA